MDTRCTVCALLASSLFVLEGAAVRANPRAARAGFAHLHDRRAQSGALRGREPRMGRYVAVGLFVTDVSDARAGGCGPQRRRRPPAALMRCSTSTVSTRVTGRCPRARNPRFFATRSGFASSRASARSERIGDRGRRLGARWWSSRAREQTHEHPWRHRPRAARQLGCSVRRRQARRGGRGGALHPREAREAPPADQRHQVLSGASAPSARNKSTWLPTRTRRLGFRVPARWHYARRHWYEPGRALRRSTTAIGRCTARRRAC